jgi:hypothetical protein
MDNAPANNLDCWLADESRTLGNALASIKITPLVNIGLCLTT